jgi:hypothetical protein
LTKNCPESSLVPLKEKMRAQREDLERRVADVERFSSLLAEKEEEVRVLQEAQARSAAERAGLEADLGRLKASVNLFCGLRKNSKSSVNVK